MSAGEKMIRFVRLSYVVVTVTCMFGGTALAVDAMGMRPPNDAASLPVVGGTRLSGTKWHPGHYILVPMDMKAKNFELVLEAVRSMPVLRGVQKRYTWASLEPEEGRYDFSEIRTDLERLGAMGKRLVVQVQYKSFRRDESYTPTYLTNAQFGGGGYRHGEGGRNALLWNDAVRDRLIALYQAMGQALDAEPFLEAVVIPESAPGDKAELLAAGYDEERYVDNLIATAKALRESFPATVTIQYANYPIRSLGRYSEVMRETGLGLGGPDTFIESTNLNRGAYQEFSGLTGVVPLAIAVQAENYSAKEHRGKTTTVPVEDLFQFARGRLRVNYAFWLWQRVPEDHFARVEKLLNELPLPYGDLNSACPSRLEVCVE